MKTLNLISLFLACSLLIACGGGSSKSSSNVPAEDDGIARSTEVFGQDGNLYKPRADGHSSGAGNLVVLLGAKFTTQFDSCEIMLNTGEIAQLICINNEEWTQVPFSCFSNGNRQTWRANFTCDAVGEVRVVCRDATREVTFVAPDPFIGSVCSRFG